MLRISMSLMVMAALALGSRSTAHAEDDPARLHLALEGALLSFTKGTSEVAGEEQDTKVLTVGYPADVGARVGYLALEFLEAGAFFSFRHQKYEGDVGLATAEYSLSAHSVGAYARYVAPGERLRVFAGLKLGGMFGKQRDEQDDDEDELEVKSRALLVGADLGVYGFLVERFSIDPLVSFAFTKGSSEFDYVFDSQEVDTTGFQVTLGLALSGWI